MYITIHIANIHIGISEGKTRVLGKSRKDKDKGKVCAENKAQQDYRQKTEQHTGKTKQKQNRGNSNNRKKEERKNEHSDW